MDMCVCMCRCEVWTGPHAILPVLAHYAGRFLTIADVVFVYVALMIYGFLLVPVLRCVPLLVCVYMFVFLHVPGSGPRSCVCVAVTSA